MTSNRFHLLNKRLLIVIQKLNRVHFVMLQEHIYKPMLTHTICEQFGHIHQQTILQI